VAGVLRIIVGLIAATAMFLVCPVLLPVVLMLVTLYICRLIPMTGRRRTSEKSRGSG
jgi:hypothetical protein